MIHFSSQLNSFALFGLTLLLGLIGGELARISRFIPRITGYIAVGFLVGYGGFHIITPTLLTNVHVFVEISLGLILFDLGRHLDFTWLRHDRGLLPMALAESGLTFILVFSGLLIGVKLSWISAALAATIAIATSPAVVMMVAHDLSAEGPVARRTLILTSLNNFFALILFILLLPLAKSTKSSSLITWAYTFYNLFGSFLLGLVMFGLTKFMAYFIGKQERNQLVLFVGIVVLTIGLADTLNFSTMLTLFTLGVAARNFDKNHRLMEVDFGWMMRLFFILLFVVIGIQIQLHGLWQATIGVLIFLCARSIAKISGIWLFAKKSRLTIQQTCALSLTLFPMAGVAIGMSNILMEFNPVFSPSIIIIITAAVAILNIFGPVITQVAFIKSGETELK